MKPFLFLAAYGLGLWCVLDFAPPAPAQADAPTVLCGTVEGNTDCTTNRAADCFCKVYSPDVSGCRQLHKVTHSKPTTFMAFSGPCALEIVTKTGFCYKQFACTNSGGIHLGSCRDPNTTQCDQSDTAWIDMGIQLYKEEVGNCPGFDPDECVPQ